MAIKIKPELECLPVMPKDAGYSYLVKVVAVCVIGYSYLVKVVALCTNFKAIM